MSYAPPTDVVDFGVRAATDENPFTIFVPSDTHVEQVPERNRDPLLRRVLKEDWEAVQQAYRCDALWHGGDLGNSDDLKEIQGYAFPEFGAVYGDEDTWPAALSYEERRRWKTTTGAGLGEKLTATIDAGKEYDVELAHKPEVFGVHQHSMDHDWGEVLTRPLDDSRRIVMHGHAHQPLARTIGKGIAVSLPSTFKNYDRKADIPERSAMVIECGDTVNIYHLDLTTKHFSEDVADEQESLYEHQRFVPTENGFEEQPVSGQDPLPIYQRFTNLNQKEAYEEVLR